MEEWAIEVRYAGKIRGVEKTGILFLYEPDIMKIVKKKLRYRGLKDIKIERLSIGKVIEK